MTTYFVEAQYRMKTFKERWLSWPWHPWRLNMLDTTAGEGTKENPYSTMAQAMNSVPSAKNTFAVLKI